LSMKKTYMVILSTVMALTAALTACSNPSGKDDASGKGGSTDEAKGTGGQEPVLTGVELSYGTADNYYAPKSLTSGLPVWNEIEKKTGIRIKWDVTPSAQYADTMKLRLAAGQNLPDMISIPEPDPVNLAQKGLIIPLDDLIAKYAPNIQSYFKASPDVAKAMRAPDGKLYALSSDVTGTAYADPYGLLIRQDWLEKLGLQEPKTLDDWYNVLKAFKERDPNGNGKADDIPLSPEANLRGLGLFGSALGLHLYYSEGYYPDKNGKIQYQWMDERAHQLIIWLNKLYKEGLIDPQFMTNTDTEVTSGITRNIIGVTNHFINNTNRFNAAQKAAGVNASWQIALPPSGDGYKGFYEKYGPISGWHAITKDSKHPEAAIKWFDYVYGSKEGEMYMNFGIEGQSYKMVNGEPQFTDWTSHNPEGLSFNEALRSLGAMPTVAWIRSANDTSLPNQMPAILKQDPYLQKQADKVKDDLQDSLLYMIGLPTLEESKQTAKLMTDIQTYQNETLSKFILGQTPIDWSKFVNTLKSLGIDEVIKNKQAQYDRFHQK